MRQFYVYIMANKSRTIYTGVTNDLKYRVSQHQSGVGSKFASKYSITRLVYYECYPNARDAIAREKQIKGWLRSKKVALIESVNPKWEDLSDQL